MPGSGESCDALPAERLPVRASVWRGALFRCRRETCQPLFSSTPARCSRAGFDRSFERAAFRRRGKHLSHTRDSVNSFLLPGAATVDLLVSAMLRFVRGRFRTEGRLARWSAKSEKIGCSSDPLWETCWERVGLGPARRAGPRVNRGGRALAEREERLCINCDLRPSSRPSRGGTITCRGGVRRQRRWVRVT